MIVHDYNIVIYYAHERKNTAIFATNIKVIIIYPCCFDNWMLIFNNTHYMCIMAIIFGLLFSISTIGLTS